MEVKIEETKLKEVDILVDKYTVCDKCNAVIEDDNGNIVFMVTTMRKDETVRVISFRRASNEERNIFFEGTGYNKALSSDGSTWLP